jgi:hypothetical protein
MANPTTVRPGQGLDCELWIERVESESIDMHGESSSESCLHCEINDVVRDHIDRLDKVDLADLKSRRAYSLGTGGRAGNITGRNIGAWEDGESAA